MTYDEYLAAVPGFHAQLAAGAAKVAAGTPMAQADFPNPETGEWLTVTARLVCENEACFHPGGVQPVLEQGDGLFRAICGECHHLVTKIIGIFDDGEHPLPAWGG